METELKHENYLQLELKYCERCGGLWLRQKGMQQVYCASCLPKMAEFSGPPRSVSQPRLPVGDRFEFEATIENLLGVRAEGEIR